MAAKNQILTGVITGDVIQSRRTSAALWLPILKKALAVEGSSPRTWEIYRGDSFQVEIRDPAHTLLAAIRIKATIKTIKNLDVRMAIGIGEKKFQSRRIAESGGEAFIYSGETLETLKKQKQNLAIKTPWPDFDREMNIFFRLASIPMDSWTTNSAELIHIILSNRDLTQIALAKKLGVTQPSVSERQNRSHYDEIMALEELFREKIIKLTS